MPYRSFALLTVYEAEHLAGSLIYNKACRCWLLGMATAKPEMKLQCLVFVAKALPVNTEQCVFYGSACMLWLECCCSRLTKQQMQKASADLLPYKLSEAMNAARTVCIAEGLLRVCLSA